MLHPLTSEFRSHLGGLFDALQHRVQHAPPRRVLRQEGTFADEVMYVEAGVFANFRSTARGDRAIVALHFPGDCILRHGERALYGVEAIEPGSVKVAKSRDFNRMLAAHPQLQQLFWRMIQRNIAIGYEWLLNCGRRDSMARVAHFLCELAVRMRSDQNQVEVPFTQRQIGDITGQTPINVSRVMGQMEQTGLIKRNGRVVEFPDWMELRRFAGFDPSYLAI